MTYRERDRSSSIARGAAAIVLAVFAQRGAAQAAIPIRQVGPIEAHAEIGKDVVTGFVATRDGHAMVIYRMRVERFDSSLATRSVVFDSSRLTSGALPVAAMRLSAATTGDSLLVFDFNASSMLVIDANGMASRSVALPKAHDIAVLTSYGTTAGFDARGRLLYRGNYPSTLPPTPGLLTATPDTFALVRGDFDSRVVDTLATLHIPTTIKVWSTPTDNGSTIHWLTQPLPSIDEWAVLSDGTVAIVRGSDYHVDWIGTDGKMAATQKMPFDWRRVTDDDKSRMIDSVKAANAAQQASNDSVSRARGTRISRPERLVVPPSDIPDYYPPLKPGAAKPDRDNNLWILPTTSSGARGGLLYDVVNRKAGLFERVQLPPACALVGFAPGGIVYLKCDGTLERTRVLR